MYEDLNIDALKEAGLRGSRIREGDDGFGWIDTLRDVATEEKSRRSSWGGGYPAARLPLGYGAGKSGKPEKPMTPDRIKLLKEAQAKVDARKKAEARPCGEPDEKPVKSPGRVRNRPSCWSERKAFALHYGKFEPVFQMVKAMAKEERQSVSDMIMVLVSAELSRKLKEGVPKPARKAYPGKGNRRPRAESATS